MPKKTHITKQFIDRLPPTSETRVWWCDKAPNLGVKQMSAGKLVWFMQYRTKEGAQRKPTLGYPPELTPKEARYRAGEIAAGKDNSLILRSRSFYAAHTIGSKTRPDELLPPDRS